MTKRALIEEVAATAGVTKRDAEAILNTAFAKICEKLASGEVVQITGFGSFRVRNRAEREIRNPRTGEKTTIAAYKAPVFKPGKALKNSVNR